MTILDTISTPPKVDPSIRRNRDPHSHDPKPSFDAAMDNAASRDEAEQAERRRDSSPGNSVPIDPDPTVDTEGSAVGDADKETNSAENLDESPEQWAHMVLARLADADAEAPTALVVVTEDAAEPVTTTSAAAGAAAVDAARIGAAVVSDDAPEATTITATESEIAAVAKIVAEAEIAAVTATESEIAAQAELAAETALAAESEVATETSTDEVSTIVRPTKSSANDAPSAASSVSFDSDELADGAINVPNAQPEARPTGGSADRVRTAAAPTPVVASFDAASVDAASAEPIAGEPAPLPTGATTSAPAPDAGARLSQQLATRELFQRIEQHRRSLDGAIEMEIVTERFGSLRIEAIDGRDGVHLSLKSDSNDQRALAELAQELRHEFDQSDVDLAGFDVEGRGGSDAHSPNGEQHLDETVIESVSSHPRLAGIAGGLDLRL